MANDPDDLILQAMDEDFRHGCTLATLRELMSNLDGLAEAGVYYFCLYLGKVSSSCPMAFLAYHRNAGCFLSVHEPTEGGGHENYVAAGEERAGEEIRMAVGQHRLSIPPTLFIPPSVAAECLEEFARSASRGRAARWVRYADLGRELYSDPE